jgi:hypothetical protein
MQKTLNVKNFEKLLKKATVDNVMEYCQLNFRGGRITTSMISRSRLVVIKHNLINNIIGGLSENDELTLQFTDPQRRIIPQLKALTSIDIEEAEIGLSDDKLRLDAGQWGHGSITFDEDEAVMNYVMRRNPRELPYFHSIIVTPEMHFGFNPVKMIAPTYGKIYFTVESEELFLDTGDKTSPASDSYRLPLATFVKQKDVTICFDFNNFAAIMSVMAAEDQKQYQMYFAWSEEDERGMILVQTSEEDEKYFLFSRDN